MYFSYVGDKMALSGQYAGLPVERSEFENHLRHVVVFWTKHFTPIEPLSTQEYKWVLSNFQGSLMKR